MHARVASTPAERGWDSEIETDRRQSMQLKVDRLPAAGRLPRPQFCALTASWASRRTGRATIAPIPFSNESSNRRVINYPKKRSPAPRREEANHVRPNPSAHCRAARRHVRCFCHIACRSGADRSTRRHDGPRRLSRSVRPTASIPRTGATSRLRSATRCKQRPASKW